MNHRDLYYLKIKLETLLFITGDCISKQKLTQLMSYYLI